MITSLTKENFWDELMEKYPDEMKTFCVWIDEYKVRIAWPFLFSGTEIKYHHLPIAMQVGIFIQYTKEVNGPNLDIPPLMDNFPGTIREWFRKDHEYNKYKPTVV